MIDRLELCRMKHASPAPIVEGLESRRHFAVTVWDHWINNTETCFVYGDDDPDTIKVTAQLRQPTIQDNAK